MTHTTSRKLASLLKSRLMTLTPEIKVIPLQPGASLPSLNHKPLQMDELISYRDSGIYKIVSRGACLSEPRKIGENLIGTISRGDFKGTNRDVILHTFSAMGISTSFDTFVARKFALTNILLTGKQTGVHFYAIKDLIPEPYWVDVNVAFKTIQQDYFANSTLFQIYPENPHPLEFEVVTRDLPSECYIGVRPVWLGFCDETFRANTLFVDPEVLKQNSRLTYQFNKLVFTYVEDIAPALRKNAASTEQLDQYNLERMNFHAEYRHTQHALKIGSASTLFKPCNRVTELESDEMIEKMKNELSDRHSMENLPKRAGKN